jgi:tubulin monoglycylase TTLL15
VLSGKNKHSGYLFHVFNVFKGLGYVPGDQRDDWTVAWMHDYPFNTFANELGKLKKHQRVNHFPGSG